MKSSFCPYLKHCKAHDYEEIRSKGYYYFCEGNDSKVREEKCPTYLRAVIEVGKIWEKLEGSYIPLVKCEGLGDLFFDELRHRDN